MEKRFVAAALSIAGMPSIDSITLEVADIAAAERFYNAAFGLGDLLRFRASDAPTTGFRGFTLSLIVAQPSTVTALVDSAVAAGATTLKPVEKSLWGYGGSVQAPDGKPGGSKETAVYPGRLSRIIRRDEAGDRRADRRRVDRTLRGDRGAPRF